MATKVKPLSGFPEYLPSGRMVEQRVLDILRETFELHGFAGIQTRSVEPLEELSRKGEITKEVYVVRRLHAETGGKDDLGLHFDLTVPFARYVLENAAALQFPFRRYQIQPAWRGERPQQGRYREFWQADIDIVGQGSLASHHDTEVLLVMLEAAGRLHDEIGLPRVIARVNNRKLMQGFYTGLGITDPSAVIAAVDKLDKIGEDAVRALLAADAGQADSIMALGRIKSPDDGFVADVRRLGASNEMLEQGLDELAALVKAVGARFPGQVVADLSVARGLDYYTGNVFELSLEGVPGLGTVSAGGRYDSLASDGRNTYPGVGISFGVSRVLAPVLMKGALQASRPVPSVVLVAVDDEGTRGVADEVAAALRARGVACEVAPDAPAYGKQIKFAERRGIPYVWFGGLSGQVKDIRSGSQADADATAWTPPAEDAKPSLVLGVLNW
ncbi:MAG: histidine--tRNA ligase [Propionibacteriaceae bacterium]|nr:histidine--tRNA ligase [Propionibacteriaceae bacterium]